MAINKPIKPSTELPDSWGGTKTEYTQAQIERGYSETVPTVIDGGNLNYEKNGIFENIDYMRKVTDAVVDTPAGKAMKTNSSNQIDYFSPLELASNNEFNAGTSTIKATSVKQVKDAVSGVLASDSEFNTGTATTKSPTVKQVKEALSDVPSLSTLLATNSEYNTGTATNKAPTVKQVKDSINGIITGAEVDQKIANATSNLQTKLPTLPKGQILVSNGTTFQGENQMAGIPLSNITNQSIKKTSNTVSLLWKDPQDTIIDGFLLATWVSTTIVKKQGSYPENIDDGTVVEVVTERNKYASIPLSDVQSNPDDWYYRAFPLSANGVYCYDKRNCFGVILYGYRINEVDPVPATRVEYLPYTDNAFHDPCVMDFVADEFNWGSWRNAFFIPKPCALRYDGTVAYYLNPDNFTLKADGSASDIADSNFDGNFMCEFPAIFVKTWKENNYINVLISNIKLDNDFECWSCKKSDGTYAPNFYLPMFEGTNINNKLRSIATTGKPTSNTNAETEATLATANGTGWNTTLWADELIMMLLFPLLFKNTNSQAVLGDGAPGSTNGLTCNNNSAVTRGLMYGTASRSASGITYLGLHNWYGHRWRRPNGLMNMNGNYAFKMTHSTIDGSTVTGFNRTGDGYISSGITPPTASKSYINRYQPIGKFGIVPKATSGSSTTFYCDGMWTNNGQLNQLLLGGSVDLGALCGAFCFFVSNLPSDSGWNVGASPSYHHL